MNMKNTVILLIFLLSIFGLIIGVCTTVDDANGFSQSSDNINIKSESQSIIIQLQNHNNEPNLINKLLT